VDHIVHTAAVVVVVRVGVSHIRWKIVVGPAEKQKKQDECKKKKKRGYRVCSSGYAATDTS
jgi:hypothetical protein